MSRQRVAVIDYGMGNLRSVHKAVEHAGAGQVEAQVTADPAMVRNADRVVFPGQGAMGECMSELRRRGLDDVVNETLGNKPFLGICVGMQALFSDSEEDVGTQGLDLIAGHVKRFPSGQQDPATGEQLKVPHMGWNEVQQRRVHPLWRGIEDLHRFYFVHSYYVAPVDRQTTAGATHYGVEFTSAAAGEGWFATQFHPEKSAAAGLQLLANFIAWDGA